jgi:glycosyltransferase involved in cell wall biosynthesis
MKILTVNNTADIYGASRCLERVFGRFAEDGHEVHAVLPEHGPLAELLQAHGIAVHIHQGLSTIDRAQLKTPIGALRFAVMFPVSVIWLAALIVRLHIDVVHSNTVVLPSPALAAALTGRKHVWHVRELLGEFGALWKPFQRYVHGLSAAIVAISKCTQDQFDMKLRDKIQVIYDGIDAADGRVDLERSGAFRARFATAERLVGVVGRIKFHRKGQEVLIRAACMVKERFPSVHYVVIGSASPGNEDHVTWLKALIAECGLQEAATLTGDMTGLPDLFAAMDIAVAPSVQAEPFGCVVMEAMAVGTPVLGSRGGGIAEQIADGETGILFTPGDEKELAAALERLLGDEALRERMGAAGPAHVKARFHLDGTYREMLALFERVSGTAGEADNIAGQPQERPNAGI